MYVRILCILLINIYTASSILNAYIIDILTL